MKYVYKVVLLALILMPVAEAARTKQTARKSSGGHVARPVR